ncbi:unnamed protein product [Caenorhabditis nigoni]
MGDEGDPSALSSGTAPSANGGFELVMAEFLSKCREVVAEKSAKKEEKVPPVGQKGLLKQAEANTKWINLLAGADESNWRDTIKSVVDSIRARNAELMLLDTNPNALKAKEQFEAIAQVSGVPLDSLDAKWIAMAQMMSTGASTSSNRHPPKRNQLFRSAGSSYRPGGVRGDYYGRHFEEFQRRPFKRAYDDRDAASGDGFRKSAVKCFSCQRIGHYATECPQRSQLTDNEFIKSVIRDGYLIPLNGAWLPSPQGLRRSARENKQFVLAELNKLLASGVVVETVSPKVVSSLHVAVNDEAIRRQRRVSHVVATSIKENPEVVTSMRVSLSEGSRNHVQLEQISFNGPEKPRSWDWHEGHKAAFFESLAEEAERAGLMHLVDSLGKAPIEARAVSTMKAYEWENQRRINWSKSLPASLSDEHRFTLYLVDRAMSAGSSSLAKAAAAFKLANDGLSPFANQLVSDVIKAQRRKEIESRAQPTQVSVNTVSKIVDMVQDDEKSERDALVVALSFYGLLRAEEASSLKWSDIRQSGNMLKLRIRRAKNDQLARGRETFCDWPEGSKRDCLLKRFRARASMRPGLDFVFQNIQKGTKLTPSAISGIAKDTLAAVGVSATHHSLRRGRANHLQQSGVDFQAIKESGRWRSDAGLRCYLSDSPRAQGFTVTELEDSDEDGPPVLQKEV